MLDRRVLGLVRTHAHEGDVHLEGRVAEEPEQLGLGDQLRRHEVDDGDAQGADILVRGPVVGHDEDVLFRELGPRGQVVGYPHWHRLILPLRPDSIRVKTSQV